FILMTYVSRTNWHAAYDNMKAQFDVSKKDATAFKEEMDKARDETKNVRNEKAQVEDQAKKDKETLTAQLKDREEKLKQSDAEKAKHVASQSSAGEELKSRANEVAYLKQLMATRDDQLKQKEAQVEQMRARMVEATLNANAERERNERLLQENEKITKD